MEASATLNYRNYLSREFESRKRRNAGYSLRAYPSQMIQSASLNRDQVAGGYELSSRHEATFYEDGKLATGVFAKPQQARVLTVRAG